MIVSYQPQLFSNFSYWAPYLNKGPYSLLYIYTTERSPATCFHMCICEEKREQKKEREREEEESRCMYLLMCLSLFQRFLSVQPPNISPPRFSSSPLHPLSLSLLQHIIEGQIWGSVAHGCTVLFNSGWLADAISTSYQLPWRLSYHGGPESLPASSPPLFISLLPPQHPGFKDSHFPNSIRVCERSICQNCLQCNWAAYLCPWDSADASPRARPACRSASAHSPAPPVLPPRTDWCLWTLSAGREQTKGKGEWWEVRNEASHPGFITPREQQS